MFPSQAIHGIKVSSTSVLAWGGHSVAVIPIETLEASALQSTKAEQPSEVYTDCAPDWIYDGCLSPYDPHKAVVITAHNEIVSLSIDNEGHGVSLGEPVSPTRSILCSAAVSWTAPTVVLVAAGTMFGEIVVWEYHAEPGKPTCSEVLFILTGHEGSIFGVDISPEIELTSGFKTRLLTSCSDDRTVRIWDITRPQSPSRPVSQAHIENLAAARETGFNSTPGLDLAQGATSSRCLASVMGHASRIWHVKFYFPYDYIKAGTSSASVYSFGEDAAVQKWKLSLPAKPPNDSFDPDNTTISTGLTTRASLKNMGRILCHNGKHIWSVALLPQDTLEPLIATGGADGKINYLRFRESSNAAGANGEHSNGSPLSAASNEITLSFYEVMESLSKSAGTHATSKATQPAKDRFLRYAFLSEGRLLVSTLSGRILLASFEDGLSWREIGVPDVVREELKGYSVIKSPRSGIAFLGSPHGRLYIFNETCGIQEIATVLGKITDVFCLSSPHAAADNIQDEGQAVAVSDIFTILVTVLGAPQATLLMIIATPPNFTVVERHTVPLERGIATSAGFCGEWLVVGKRSGTIAVYAKTAAGFVCQALRSDCKNKDAVTSIVPLPPLQRCAANSFLTTCRDGRYRIYEIQTHATGQTFLRLQHETSPPLGPMLEGALLTQTHTGGLELIIYGFRSKDFIVWNETQQQEVAAVACGGAHRTFDYIPGDDGDGNGDGGALRFVYTKASQMGVYSQPRMLLRTVKHGSHGREIRAVAASALSKYVATAGEDTCLRIWTYASPDSPGSSSPSLRCQAILEKHSAGIQCLKWHGEEYLLSSAGNEELFVWRVASLKSRYEGLSVVCEAAYPDRTPDSDLRIVGFDVTGDPAGGPGMLISLVLSNSSLKSYRYSQEVGFQLLAQGVYTGACLTQVRHLPLPGNKQALLTTSTDGHAVVWEHGEQLSVDGGGEAGMGPYSVVLVTKLHQNAIKCLDVKIIDTTDNRVRWEVVAGGDDNALCILDVAWLGEDGGFVLLGRSRAKDAHAAAITGITFVGVDEQYDLVATTSNDQRIKVWGIRNAQGGKGKRVALLSNQYSAIADPGDLELLAPGKLIVGGVGMETWTYSRNS